MKKTLILSTAIALVSFPALAEAVAVAPVAQAASIDVVALLTPLWNAAITTGFAGYLIAWVAAFLPQPGPSASPAWNAARWVIDLIAANVANAKNAPKA